jgi:SSS family solute:Na+ symporter
MNSLDWAVLIAFFALMLGIGWWARLQVVNAADFFTAGGKMPWWLSGISHHMSGYSAAVFVGYAAICYKYGFAMYTWWAFTIAIGLTIGAILFAPRWARLRIKYKIISPMEYMATRYDVPTQQLLSWSVVFLKIFDVAAKWTATALLLNVLADVPMVWGIILTGGVTMIYATIGGLWADALTDFSQFLIQLVAGVVLLVAVLAHLGGVSALWTIWDRLPASHSQLTNGEYTGVFAAVYLLIHTLTYNGGTWNLAQRYIASPSASSARKAALLSASLYLVWPLVLFFPMWAAPLILPNLANPSQSYGMLTEMLLPHGLMGLVLAGMFAHTMAMTSSDANAIAAVVTRDLLPKMWSWAKDMDEKRELLLGRITTTSFILFSMGVSMVSDYFGGVLGLIILWYGALIGPTAIPMLFGMLKPFRRSGPLAVYCAIGSALTVFALVKFKYADVVKTLNPDWVTTITVAGPVLTAITVFYVVGLVRPYRKAAAAALIEALQSDDGMPTPVAVHAKPVAAE